ncbi:Sua5/YciO/YrdC/YwlC family protein [Streptomyces sp. NPDC088748]|uniref:Sua5/YciO/YrdC/YwlC family protein n=1 Tax=Streptomyces sp. NPDC088748 TaxID=3365887 RepID=UPI003810B515
MNTEAAGHRGAVDLDEARRALRAGAAVVLPNPAPLTHVVTATTPHAVNEAKGRPPGQAVALWAHHAETLRTVLAVARLDAAATALAARLLTEEHLTVLLPLRTDPHLPDWLAPAAQDGRVLLFAARWQPLRPLLDEHPVLYVSSANRTGLPPAATTAEALAVFPAAVPVLRPPHGADGPAGGPARRATTTVAVHPDGRLTLHRHGAQDRSHPHPDDYLDHLRARYGSSASRIRGR